jgi:FMN reductase
MPSILAISGSPSPTSRTGMVLERVAAQLADREEYHARILSVRDLPPAALFGADVHHPAIAAAAEAVAAADGVVVATPVYKAAYSGALKALLDLLPQFALAGKAVLPLATGGSQAHVLALDYALRPVLSSMGADHILPGYFILERLITVGPDGALAVAEPARSQLDGVVTAFVDALDRRPRFAARV